MLLFFFPKTRMSLSLSPEGSEPSQPLEPTTNVLDLQRSVVPTIAILNPLEFLNPLAAAKKLLIKNLRYAGDA